MKFYLFISLLSFALSSGTILSNHEAKIKIAEGKLLDISVDQDMADEDPCFGHGGAVTVGVSWNIATCKSKCTRGLGFRCGMEYFIGCSDGTTTITGGNGGSCPYMLVYEARHITAQFNFYDNNTLRFIFLSPLPEDENGNNDFEIEDDVVVSVPHHLLIGGKHYSSFRIKQGTYRVNRDAGENGEVYVDINYNE